VSRSSKAVKGKRKVEAKKARPAVKRRAVPERMRSDRRVDEGRPDAAKRVTDELRGNAGGLAGQAISPADSSDPPRRQETLVGAVQIYPPATILAALQVWFLLPLRSLQIWQEAWFRLLPR
jgi:hypothetical protein